MRVKQKYVIHSAESAAQQSQGGAAKGPKPWAGNEGYEALKGGTIACVALSGLAPLSYLGPRVPEPAGADSFTLGFAATRLRRSLDSSNEAAIDLTTLHATNAGALKQ